MKLNSLFKISLIIFTISIFQISNAQYFKPTFDGNWLNVKDNVKDNVKKKFWLFINFIVISIKLFINKHIIEKNSIKGVCL